MVIAVRTDLHSLLMAASIRKQVHALEKNQAVANIHTAASGRRVAR